MRKLIKDMNGWFRREMQIANKHEKMRIRPLIKKMKMTIKYPFSHLSDWQGKVCGAVDKQILLLV